MDLITIIVFVIDIFLVSMDNPIRIEFFDDEIEKISEFDVNSQLRHKYIDCIKIYPTTEFIVNVDDEIKHYMLPKYIKTESIIDFMNNPIVFINDYCVIETPLRRDVEH